MLNLKVAARKKQMGWVFSPLSANRRAFGEWTRVERHFGSVTQGNGGEGILFKYKEEFGMDSLKLMEF